MVRSAVVPDENVAREEGAVAFDRLIEDDRACGGVESGRRFGSTGRRERRAASRPAAPVEPLMPST